VRLPTDSHTSEKIVTIIQAHFLTPYPASCLARGIDGRPKMERFGGVDRGRVPSASLKRAIRTSRDFQASLHGNLGSRTARVGSIVAKRLREVGFSEDKALAAARDVAEAFGKVKEDSANTEQLAFVSSQEIDAATDLAMRIASGEVSIAAKTAEEGGKGKGKGKKNGDAERRDILGSLLGETVSAADIALFGRMFADRGELRLTAACAVAHAFTVGRASLESDFYVAVDDEKSPEEDVGAQFLGEQFFTAGLFYGYARIDMEQLVANLGGNRELADTAAAAFVRGLATVSPTGKSASFGSFSRAHWVMIERGESAPRTLAGAFLRPVSGEDQFAEAVERAEGLAETMDTAYGDQWERRVMNVPEGRGTLNEVLGIVSSSISA
jgi:CRISPR system Cascade subunit CasC